jgi:hypothetical protein
MAKKETAFGGSISYTELTEIGKKLGENPDIELIREQLQLMAAQDTVQSQRAAAIIFHCADVNPKIFERFMPEMLAVLEKPIHDSGPRTIFRILESELNIDEAYAGKLIDLAFKYLQDPKSAIAIKVFSMTFIANQLLTYPDLKHELESTLSAQMELGSAGFRNRASKLAEKFGLDI